MASSMAKENIFGLMDPAIKDSSWKASDKVKEAGSQPRTMEISTLELTKEIKRMDMEDMCGQMAACTKVDLPTMSSKFSVI